MDSTGVDPSRPASSRRQILTIFVLAGSALASSARADVVCPDSSYVTVSFACTFTGLYQPGEPYNYVTTCPLGDGESLAAAGITISVHLEDCQGTPLAGVAAQDIVLTAPTLCPCGGGNIADAPTDANGNTTFSGTLAVGGYAESLTIVAGGVTVGSVPVVINSFDSSPSCSIDTYDLEDWFNLNGKEVGDPGYDVRYDFNEDGFLDIKEYALFNRHLAHRRNSCGPAVGATSPAAGGTR